VRLKQDAYQPDRVVAQDRNMQGICRELLEFIGVRRRSEDSVGLGVSEAIKTLFPARNTAAAIALPAEAPFFARNLRELTQSVKTTNT
jgi:hypothetical protein